MRKILLSFLLLITLTGCGLSNENSNDPDITEENTTTIADDINHNKDKLPLDSFYLTLMQGTSPKEFEEFQPNHSYELHIPERTLVVKEASSMIGLDGREIQPSMQKLQYFEVNEDGAITFSFDQKIFTENDSWIENRTVTFEKLSDTIYEDENGIRYQLTEEEADY